RRAQRSRPPSSAAGRADDRRPRAASGGDPCRPSDCAQPTAAGSLRGRAGGVRPAWGAVTDRACDRCLARAWLLRRLAGHLEHARGRVELALGLSDAELIAALGGRQRTRLETELG